MTQILASGHFISEYFFLKIRFFPEGKKKNLEYFLPKKTIDWGGGVETINKEVGHSFKKYLSLNKYISIPLCPEEA